MWLELIALAAAVVLVVQGARWGALLTGLQIVALVFGYGGALLVGPPVGRVLAAALGTGEILTIVAASSGVFVIVMIAMRLAVRGIRRTRKREREKVPQTTADQVAGAGLGAVQGAALGLMLGVLGIWMETGRERAEVSLPDLGGAALGAVTRHVIEGASELVLDPEDGGAKLAVRLAVRPTATLEDLTRIMDNGNVRRVAGDSLFWSYVKHGAVDQALHSASFMALARDDTLWSDLAAIGAVRPEQADDPAERRRVARTVITEAGPRLRAVLDDPALAELSRDEALLGAARDGDLLTVIRDARVRALVDRALGSLPESAESAETPEAHSAEPLDAN
jgi:hypothetical protein